MNKKERSKIVSAIFLVNIFLIVYLLLIFYETQPATYKNTQKAELNIQNAEIISLPRHQNKIAITTNNGKKYIIIWHNTLKKAQVFINDISKSQSMFSVTVWEHYPRFFLGEKISQIVEFEDAQQILYSKYEHNKDQKTNRISGLIMGFIIWIIALGLITLYIWINKSIPKKSRKRRRRLK